MTPADNTPEPCEKECGCKERMHDTQLVVLTGGPGAGKTAVLEIIRKKLCEHVVILPEAASVVFGGGFWRLDSPSARMAAQRAIFHIQQEMENLVTGEHQWALGLCDRGVLDGMAYWPGEEEAFWETTGTDVEREYARYRSVIHLRTPSHDEGYNHENPLRVETADEAARIDEKIHDIWSGHPRYRTVGSMPDFMDKVKTTVDFIIEDLPACCRKTLE